MKVISILLFTSLLLVTSVIAQSSTKNKVEASVEAFRKAMIDADKSALENLIAKELSYGHSSGVVESKPQLLEVIVNGKNDYVTMDLSNQTISIVDNIALVRHTMVAEILIEGAVNTLKLGVLLVWQMKENKWQLLARQAYKL